MAELRRGPGRPRIIPEAHPCSVCGKSIKLSKRKTCSSECFSHRMHELGVKRRAGNGGRGYTQDCIKEILATISNRSQVAKLLGISRARLYQILEQQYR